MGRTRGPLYRLKQAPANCVNPSSAHFSQSMPNSIAFGHGSQSLSLASKGGRCGDSICKYIEVSRNMNSLIKSKDVRNYTAFVIFTSDHIMTT